MEHSSKMTLYITKWSRSATCSVSDQETEHLQQKSREICQINSFNFPSEEAM